MAKQVPTVVKVRRPNKKKVGMPKGKITLPGLHKRDAFVNEFFRDFCVSRAMQRTVPKYDTRIAREVGYQYMQIPEVKAAIKRRMTALYKKCMIQSEDVIRLLIRNEREAFENGRIADSTRCLELLGKNLALFADKVDTSTTVVLGPTQIIFNVVDPKTGKEVKEVIEQKCQPTINGKLNSQ